MNIFKKIAVLAVTAYARRTFEQTAKRAEQRSRETGRPVYVITDQFSRHNRLMILTYREYKTLRNSLGFEPIYFSLPRLRSSCWYHTEDTEGTLSNKDRETRKRAFVKDCLINAKLVTE